MNLLPILIGIVLAEMVILLWLWWDQRAVKARDQRAVKARDQLYKEDKECL